ncbi:WecB/TagA/CpsF family glycosyltransferase [Sphingorhabdus sp.]|uniref:WecB/TagA/CpsF family glycosyltransferase n=1 Tax=Sphingorhabdus sp. TaxID=1902408 RepID=UPI0039188DD8
MMSNIIATSSTLQRHSKTDFLGVSFDDLNAQGALDEVKLLVGMHAFSYVVTPNVDHVVALNDAPDSALVDAYANAHLTLCDSRILSLLARRSGLTLHAVPGSDLTRELLDLKNTSWRCAVIGGDAELHERIAELYPQHAWVFHQPPMGVRRNAGARERIAEFVESAEADLVFFAIGAPQSEICCHEITKRNRARGVALCIGASLEFLTGAKKRAPYWMQRSSLEWLHRLSSEPRRLWRRYLVEGPKILVIWRRWRTLNGARHPFGSGSTPFDGR